jgi:hypothetical protein
MHSQSVVLNFIALTLMKVRPTWPSFIDVRAHTFGQYLIHPILLKLFFAPITLVATFLSEYLVGSRRRYGITQSLLSQSEERVFCLKNLGFITPSEACA